MVLNKMELFSGKSSEEFETQMSSELERKSEASGDRARIIGFRIAFASFYLMCTVISWWTIVASLKSVDFFEDFPPSCQGPHEAPRKNIYPHFFFVRFLCVP